MNSSSRRPEIVPVYKVDEASSGSSSSSRPQFRELELLAEWLDSIFQIPGTKIRFGLDALLGLIPGLGDTATSAASLYILLAASRYGVSRITMLRMAANIAVDYAVGSIPLLGDTFDVFWKANQKNVELLREHAKANQSQVRRLQTRDWLFFAGLAFLLIALLVGSVTIAYWIVGSLWQLIHSGRG